MKKQRTDLKVLRQKNLETKRWYCKECDIAFATRKELFAHNKWCPYKEKSGNCYKVKHDFSKSTCEYCGKVCFGRTALTTHQIYFCEKSDKFDIKKAKSRHQQVVNNNKRMWTEEQRVKQSKATVFNHFWEYRAKNPIIYESKIAGKLKLDSYWELETAKRLDELNVEWHRPKIRLPYFNSKGEEHGYFPDFYVKTYHCFLEVKSKYVAEHQNSEGKIDYVKQHYPFVVWLETENACKTFKLEDLHCSIVPEKDEQNIDFWLEKLEQSKKERLEKAIAKKEKERLLEQTKKERLEKRKNAILNCGVNLSKFGWLKKVVEATGLSRKVVQSTMKDCSIQAFHRKGLNSHAGRHWWTNGLEEISSEVCPDGWHAGRSDVSRLASANKK